MRYLLKPANLAADSTGVIHIFNRWLAYSCRLRLNMRVSRVLVFFIGAIYFSPQAHAHGSQNTSATVQGYFEFCSSKEEMLRDLCTFFIMGVGDMMGVNGRVYETAPTSVRPFLQKTSLCTGTPRYVPSTSAMVQAFLNWAQKHPEKWDYAGSVGVALALSETWPCRK